MFLRGCRASGFRSADRSAAASVFRRADGRGTDGGESLNLAAGRTACWRRPGASGQGPFVRVGCGAVRAVRQPTLDGSEFLLRQLTLNVHFPDFRKHLLCTSGRIIIFLIPGANAADDPGQEHDCKDQANPHSQGLGEQTAEFLFSGKRQDQHDATSRTRHAGGDSSHVPLSTAEAGLATAKRRQKLPSVPREAPRRGRRTCNTYNSGLSRAGPRTPIAPRASAA